MKLKKRDQISLTILGAVLLFLLVLFVVKHFSTLEKVNSDENPVVVIIEKTVQTVNNIGKEADVVELSEASVIDKFQDNSEESWQENLNIFSRSWQRIKNFFDKKLD